MNAKKLSLVAFAALAMVTATSAAAFAETAMATKKTDVLDDNSSSGDWLDKLHAGEIVDVVDCWGKWCFIEHKGPDGWVRKKHLDFDYGYYTDDFDIGFGIYSDNGGISFGFEISN